MPSLAPQELIQQLHFPNVVATDSYLNDPIEFAPDPRFLPVSALQQLQVLSIVNRDPASFAIITLNSGPQLYSAQTYSPLYDREGVDNVLQGNSGFSYFVAAT